MLGQKQRGGLMPSTSAWLCPSELHPVPQDGPAHPQHDEAGTAEQQGAGHPFPACHCSHTRLMGSCHREQLIWGFEVSSLLPGVCVGHEEAPGGGGGGSAGAGACASLLRTRPGCQGLKRPQLSALLMGFPRLLMVWHSHRCDAVSAIWGRREDAALDLLSPGLCCCSATGRLIHRGKVRISATCLGVVACAGNYPSFVALLFDSSEADCWHWSRFLTILK